MKEWKIILIAVLFLIGVGVFSLFFLSEFNFYRSEISVDGLTIHEKLYFKPHQDYHTLYRNFVDPLTVNDKMENSISLTTLSCSLGNAYARTYSTCYDKNLNTINCPSYTEDNEYGCTFGDHYGFLKGNDYSIQAEYIVHPLNIFSIKGNNYVKFVVYSPKNHKFLYSNFEVNGDSVKNNFYLPNENVILYIPYQGTTKGLNLIYANDFEFDSHFRNLFDYLLLFFPAIGLLLIWFIFGRERITVDMPSELSMMPQVKRKPWQVSAFFCAPFGIPQKNLFAATLLDFYHKKIIDIKTEKKMLFTHTFVRILKSEVELDEVENFIMNSLKILEEKKGHWFELKADEVHTSKLWKNGSELRTKLIRESKEYVSKDGVYMSIAFVFFLFVILFLTNNFSTGVIVSLFFFIMITIILNTTTSLFSRHKKEYYSEYCHWQAFRKYLKNSFTIREGTHKTVVMWDDYLIYATALGVPDRVLKELEDKGILTENQAAIYRSVYVSSIGFASSSGGTSGGHGGAGGGGVGGGGGGGR